MRLSKAAISVGALLVSAASGYGVATVVDRYNLARRDARISAETISNVAGMIYLLDSGDLSGTRTALLSMGSANLDPLIEQWENKTGLTEEYLASRCRAVTRLRELRLKHKFLMEPSDTSLLSIPDIKEAEMRRRAFLESIRCKKPSG